MNTNLETWFSLELLIASDILVFNTSPHAHSPIYVIESSMLCGQVSNTDMPICLAYDQNHYEVLVPDTDNDLLETIHLKEDFVRGNYSKKMDILPFLKQTEDMNTSRVGEKHSAQALQALSSGSLNTKRTKLEETKFPKINAEDQDLDCLRKLGKRNRTHEQETIYKKLMQQKQRRLKQSNQTDEEKEIAKKYESERKRKEREKRTTKEKDKKENQLRMKTMREKQTQEEKKGLKVSKIVSSPLFEIAISVETAEFKETDYDFFKYHNVGNIFQQPACQHCHAQRWPHPLESPNFCCKDGKLLESVQP